jgi:hypothetical protein
VRKDSHFNLKEKNMATPVALYQVRKDDLQIAIDQEGQVFRRQMKKPPIGNKWGHWCLLQGMKANPERLPEKLYYGKHRATRIEAGDAKVPVLPQVCRIINLSEVKDLSELDW